MKVETSRKVGFIGLGGMGTRMALQLLRARHDVTVFDVVPSRVEPLAAAGARCVDSARAVGDQAETVFACLPSPQVGRLVAFGDEGIVRGKAVRHYVECSTIGIECAEEIGARLTERTIGFILARIFHDRGI